VGQLDTSSFKAEGDGDRFFEQPCNIPLNRLIYVMKEERREESSLGLDTMSLDELEAALMRVPAVDAFWIDGDEPILRKELLDITDVIVRSINPKQLFVVTDGSYTSRIIDFCRNRSLKIPLHLVVKIAHKDSASEKEDGPIAPGPVDRRDHVFTTLEQLQYGIHAWNMTFSCIWGAVTTEQEFTDSEILGVAFDARGHAPIGGTSEGQLVTRSIVERKCAMNRKDDARDKIWPTVFRWSQFPWGSIKHSPKPDAKEESPRAIRRDPPKSHQSNRRLLLLQNGDFWDVETPRHRFICNLRLVGSR
jgi:hypothetical protein